MFQFTRALKIAQVAPEHRYWSDCAFPYPADTSQSARYDYRAVPGRRRCACHAIPMVTPPSVRPPPCCAMAPPALENTIQHPDELGRMYMQGYSPVRGENIFVFFADFMGENTKSCLAARSRIRPRRYLEETSVSITRCVQHSFWNFRGLIGSPVSYRPLGATRWTHPHGYPLERAGSASGVCSSAYVRSRRTVIRQPGYSHCALRLAGVNCVAHVRVHTVRQIRFVRRISGAFRSDSSRRSWYAQFWRCVPGYWYVAHSMCVVYAAC